MICPNCNCENREGAKFCNECGADLSTSKASTIVLPQISLEEDSSSEQKETVEDKTAQVSSTQTVKASNVQAAPAQSAQTAASKNAQIAADKIEQTDTKNQNTLNGPANLNTSQDEAFEHQKTQAVQHKQNSNTSEVTSKDSAKAQLKDSANSSATDVACIEALHGLDVSADEQDGPFLWEKGATLEMPSVSDEGGYSNVRSFRVGSEDTPKKRSKLPFIIVALLIVVAVAVAGITWYFELWGGVKVPDVVALSQTDAQDLLKEKGFIVRVEQVKSDDEEGIVLLTDPSAGSRIEQGGEVIINVSVSRVIPNVVGLNVEEAQELLTKEGYENFSIEYQKSNETEDSVLSVTPDQGSKVKAAYPIVLTAAIAYTVPDVVGKTKDEAKEALEAEGYSVTLERYYTEDSSEGTIVSCSPEAGTKLNSGSEVVIYYAVSRASELEQLTRGMLGADETITISGTSYLIQSLNSVSYSGSDAVSFSIEAQPYTSFLGETIYLSTRTVTGTVYWTSDNSVSSITG
jgi:eukaryotic-like serine/threonine-protein kinase